MKRVPCPLCNMRGRVFDDDLCTNCAGTGFVPDPGRRNGHPPPGPSRPLAPALKNAILILALAGGAVSYFNSGGSLEKAGLGFLLLLVTGLVLGHMARNLIAYLVLAAGFYGLDQALWAGQAMPWALNAAEGIVIQACAAAF